MKQKNWDWEERLNLVLPEIQLKRQGSGWRVGLSIRDVAKVGKGIIL